MTAATPPASILQRARGQTVVARALWYVKPGVAELRPERLNAPSGDMVRVKTAYSGISRGTERLVAHGDVPPSEFDTMRAPMQSGAFPFPVKYGYAAVGDVVAGADTLIGQRVFVLHPHQDFFDAPAGAVVVVPETVSAKRATLAANMETALNAHWDAGTGLGHRILVVGAGIVGLLVAYLAQRIAGPSVTITDIDPAAAERAASLGLSFVLTPDVARDNHIVFHTSASSAGLATALQSTAFEGSIIEMSWYGAKPVTVPLGAAFHSRRLRLISSQVGHVAQPRRATTTHRQRLETALNLLADPLLDALVSDEIAFDDLAAELPRVWQAGGLPPVIRYP